MTSVVCVISPVRPLLLSSSSSLLLYPCLPPWTQILFAEWSRLRVFDLVREDFEVLNTLSAMSVSAMTALDTLAAQSAMKRRMEGMQAVRSDRPAASELHSDNWADWKG